MKCSPNCHLLKVFFLPLSSSLVFFLGALGILFWEDACQSRGDMLVPFLTMMCYVFIGLMFLSAAGQLYWLARFPHKNDVGHFLKKAISSMILHVAILASLLYYFLLLNIELLGFFPNRYITQQKSPNKSQTAYLYEAALSHDCLIFLRDKRSFILKKTDLARDLSCVDTHQQILIWSHDSQNVDIFHPDKRPYDIPSKPFFLFEPLR